jgi:flavin-dependent dehydrogenase
MPVDALIVGAGPAGSAAARLLAQAGWNVVLAEKTEFPRRKVCGEFMSATTMPVLQSCGVAAAFLASAGPPVTRVGIYANDAKLAGEDRKVWGRALGREHLDTLLRDAAVAADARLLQPAELTQLHQTSYGYCCTVQDEEIHTRIVIAACGSWRSKGVFALAANVARPSDLFAFKAHFRGSALPQGLMPLLAFAGGYGGMVHSDDGRTSLSCCIRRDAMAAARRRHGGKAAEAVLAHILATTRGVAEALGGATLDGDFLSTGPIHPGIRPRRQGNIFFTGNIAGEAHPVIAEGISMAIQSSGLLAKLLIAGREENYAGAWYKRFAPRIHAASLFAHLAMNDATRAVSLAGVRGFPSLLDWGARLSGKEPISA